jgi:hypothetical protein
VAERHEDVTAWTQREACARLDRRSRHEAERIGLGRHGQDHLHLEHREALPDAPPRAAAEREVGEARAANGSRRGKPLRVEPLGVLLKGQVTLQHVRAQEERRSGRDPGAAELVVSHGRAGRHRSSFRSTTTLIPFKTKPPLRPVYHDFRGKQTHA